MTINAALKKRTFRLKNSDGSSTVSIIAGINADAERLIIIDESYAQQFTYLGLEAFGDPSLSIPTQEISQKEFEASFGGWMKPLAERIADENAAKEKAALNYNGFKDDYDEAVKLDILIDAARGVDPDVLLRRMNAIVNSEKEKTRKAEAKVSKAFEKGFKKGRGEGMDEGMKIPRTSLEGTGFDDYWDS